MGKTSESPKESAIRRSFILDVLHIFTRDTKLDMGGGGELKK